MQIRVAGENDAAVLVEIYSYYVEKTAVTFEYKTPSVEEFAGRIRDIQKKYPYPAHSSGCCCLPAITLEI